MQIVRITTTLSGTCRSSLAICPRGAFLAAFLLITLYLSGFPGVALASEPVDRTLVGCVVEGRFFSLGSAHFEPDLNKAEELYQDLVSAERLSRAYPIMLFSDENYLHELDLSRYEGKALGMKGSLLPGDIFFISDTDSVIVLRDSCHEHLLTFIQQRIDPDFLPPDTTSDTQADVQQTTTGTHAASELESLDRITVRALRGWGHLPPKFDRLALDLRGKGIDILGFDHEQVQELARQASAPDSPLQAQGADLKELAELMVGFVLEIDGILVHHPASGMQSADYEGVTISDWIFSDLPASTQPQTVTVGDDFRVTFPGSALEKGGRAVIGRIIDMQPITFGSFDSFCLYDVSLDGHHTFADDVILECSYDPSKVNPSTPLEEQIMAVSWDAERNVWVELSSTIDADRQIITMRTNHLSIKGVLYNVRVLVAEPFKRAFNSVILTNNFRLYFNKDKLETNDVIRNWPGETTFEHEYENLWNYQNPAWIPFIRDVAYYLEKSLAAYRNAGLEPIRIPVTFEIGPGRGGRQWILFGKTRPGAYDYTIARAYISSDRISRDRSMLQHILAHELFHAIQHREFPNNPEKGIDEQGLWWIEATAEFAAAGIAWDHRRLNIMGRRDVYPRLLELPLTASGVPPQDRDYPEVEYDKGYIIDFLVRRGADFARMHTNVLRGYVQTGDPLASLERHLLNHGPRPMPALFREASAWFLLSSDSPLSRFVSDDPLDFVPGGRAAWVSADEEARPLRQTFSLDAPYTAQLWALKAETGDSLEPRILRITPEQLSDWAVVDLFVLEDHVGDSSHSPSSRSSLVATDEPVRVSLNPNETLYALVVNLDSKRKAHASLVVEQDQESFEGTHVLSYRREEGEQSCTITWQHLDQTETTETLSLPARPPDIIQMTIEGQTTEGQPRVVLGQFDATGGWVERSFGSSDGTNIIFTPPLFDGINALENCQAELFLGVLFERARCTVRRISEREEVVSAPPEKVQVTVRQECTAPIRIDLQGGFMRDGDQWYFISFEGEAGRQMREAIREGLRHGYFVH